MFQFRVLVVGQNGGFIGNHYAQEQLTGAIVSGWQRVSEGLVGQDFDNVAAGLELAANTVSKMADDYGQS